MKLRHLRRARAALHSPAAKKARITTMKRKMLAHLGRQLRASRRRWGGLLKQYRAWGKDAVFYQETCGTIRFRRYLPYAPQKEPAT